MKLNSINSLLGITVGLLLTAMILYWTQVLPDDKKLEQSNNAQTNEQLNEQPNDSLNNELNTSANLDSLKITSQENSNPSNKNNSKNKSNASVNNFSKGNDITINKNAGQIDFSKYITDPRQINEIAEVTNRIPDDLEIETLPNGVTKVDLKKRWSTVHVIVADEEGNVHKGEWAPSSEK